MNASKLMEMITDHPILKQERNSKVSRKDQILRITKTDRRYLFDHELHYLAGVSGKVDTTRHACDQLCTTGQLEKKYFPRKDGTNGKHLTKYRFKKGAK